MPYAGVGSTVRFYTSSFNAGLLSMKCGEIKREHFDITSMASSVAKVFTPSADSDAGIIELTVFFDYNAAPPALGTSETVEVRFNGGLQWKGSMFLESFDFGAPLENAMTATIRLKVTGPIECLGLLPVKTDGDLQTVTTGGETVYTGY